MMQTILNVLLVILLIVLVFLVIVYFYGRKMQGRQVEQQQMIEANKQIVSILVIDKKLMKMKEIAELPNGLPKQVFEEIPWYGRFSKLPIVKAKIGPKIMTLIADESVYAALPVKTEAKVAVSGIYITEIKAVRGGMIPASEQKKGFLTRMREKFNGK